MIKYGLTNGETVPFIHNGVMPVSPIGSIISFSSENLCPKELEKDWEKYEKFKGRRFWIGNYLFLPKIVKDETVNAYVQECDIVGILEEIKDV